MVEKHIPRTAYVLDIGSGDHPHRRADVLCDRYPSAGMDLSRRRGDVVIDRPFVLADVTALPFADKSFDYVMCCTTLDQVDNVARALEEISRVGKAGYISTYSEVHEFLSPYMPSRWVARFKDGTLLLKSISAVHKLGSERLYGSLFWHLHQDKDFRRFMLEHSKLFWVEFEWQDRISYRLVPEDSELYNYHRASDLDDLTQHTLPKGVINRLKHFARVTLADTEKLSAMVFRINRLWTKWRHHILKNARQL